MVVKSIEEILSEQNKDRLNNLYNSIYWANFRVAQINLNSLRKIEIPDYKIDNRLTIYIAGPHMPYNMKFYKDSIEFYNKLQAMTNIGIKIVELGHFPFIPDYLYIMHMLGKKELDEKTYNELETKWLEKCDALLYPYNKIGLSDGSGHIIKSKADNQLELAIKEGKLIFLDIKHIPKYSLIV